MHWVPRHIWPHTPRALAVLMWLLNSNTPLDTKFQHHWPADESFGFNLPFSCWDSVVAQGFASHPCTRECAYSRARQPVLNHAESSPVLRGGPRLPLEHGSTLWRISARTFLIAVSFSSDSARQLPPYLWQGPAELNVQQRFRATALHKSKIFKCFMQLVSHLSVLHGSRELLPSVDASCCKFSGFCKTGGIPTFFPFSHYKHRLKTFCLTSNLTCICSSLFSKIYYVLLGF